MVASQDIQSRTQHERRLRRRFLTEAAAMIAAAAATTKSSDIIIQHGHFLYILMAVSRLISTHVTTVTRPHTVDFVDSVVSVDSTGDKKSILSPVCTRL